MSHARASLSDLIGSGYTALTVTGLMLPLSGIVVRYVHFLIVDHLRGAESLAVTLPIGELAFTGLGPVLTGVSLMAFMYTISSLFSRDLRLAAVKMVPTAIIAGVAGVGALVAGATVFAIITASVVSLSYAIVSIGL